NDGSSLVTTTSNPRREVWVGKQRDGVLAKAAGGIERTSSAVPGEDPQDDLLARWNDIAPEQRQCFSPQTLAPDGVDDHELPDVDAVPIVGPVESIGQNIVTPVEQDRAVLTVQPGMHPLLQFREAQRIVVPF